MKKFANYKIHNCHTINELFQKMSSVVSNHTNGVITPIMISDLMTDSLTIGQDTTCGFWWIVRDGGTTRTNADFSVIEKDWLPTIMEYNWKLCYISVDREKNIYRLTTYTFE